MTNFETAINRILSHEGGYVDNPADPGGRTQWGISQRSYPNLDIKSLTRDQAIALYERDFWEPIKVFPWGLGINYWTLRSTVEPLPPYVACNEP